MKTDAKSPGTEQTSAGDNRPMGWFHSFDVEHGEPVQGTKTKERLQFEADLVFKHPVAGKSVLDIGAADGFFSFEAERRGAARVVAAEGPLWKAGGKGRFDAIHAQRNSRVESWTIDLFDLDPERHGKFDVVLMLGVLYHLKNPLEGLERAAAMAKELVVVETQIAADSTREPVLQFFAGADLNNDPTNYWAPNIPCLRLMLSDIGFKRVDIVESLIWNKPRSFFRRPKRHVCRATAHAHW